MESHLPLTRSAPWEEMPAVVAVDVVFPVAPEDVPGEAVNAVKRTLLRHADRGPLDDDLARLVVAAVIAMLAEDGETLEAAGELISELALATGAEVVMQALP
jgi:hypothetical protein